MSVLKHNKVLYKKVCQEFFNNCLWYQVDGHYFEQIGFQEALLLYIFNICELNPTNKVASMVHVILKSFLFEKPRRCSHSDRKECRAKKKCAHFASSRGRASIVIKNLFPFLKRYCGGKSSKFRWKNSSNRYFMLDAPCLGNFGVW